MNFDLTYHPWLQVRQKRHSLLAVSTAAAQWHSKQGDRRMLAVQGGMYSLINYVQEDVEVFKVSRRTGLAMSTNGTAGCVYRPAVRASTTYTFGTPYPPNRRSSARRGGCFLCKFPKVNAASSKSITGPASPASDLNSQVRNRGSEDRSPQEICQRNVQEKVLRGRKPREKPWGVEGPE